VPLQDGRRKKSFEQQHAGCRVVRGPHGVGGVGVVETETHRQPGLCWVLGTKMNKEKHEEAGIDQGGRDEAMKNYSSWEHRTWLHATVEGQLETKRDLPMFRETAS